MMDKLAPHDFAGFDADHRHIEMTYTHGGALDRATKSWTWWPANTASGDLELFLFILAWETIRT